MQPITQERIDDLVYRQLLDNIKTNKIGRAHV